MSVHAVLTHQDDLVVVMVADDKDDGAPFLVIEVERDAKKNAVAIDLKTAPALSERAILLRNPDRPDEPTPGSLLPPAALLSLDFRAPKRRVRKKAR